MHIEVIYLLIYYLGLVSLFWALKAIYLHRPKQSDLRTPPLVTLSREDVYNHPVESMTKALRDHGPVVQIKRNGNSEYLVAAEYTSKVLIRADTFSFDDALAKLMGMTLLHRWKGQSFLKDVHNAIKSYWATCKDDIEAIATPIFTRAATEVRVAGGSGDPIDIVPYINKAVIEVTLRMFFGEKYITPDFCHRTQEVVEDFVELTGLNRQQSYLGRHYPVIWTIKTWACVGLFRLPSHIGLRFTSSLWADISNAEKSENGIISFLVSKRISPSGTLSWGSKIRIMAMAWSIIFGAIHQTVAICVWASFFLAQHRDMQEIIRHESVPSTAVFTDAFIREVLRMKPDAVNAARMAAKDTELAGYFLPKGSFIFPVTYLSDRSLEYVSDPDTFAPERWLHSGKTAVMPGAGYLAFGLGRWACPGRFLSVLEIKLWLLAFTKVADFELEGDSYEIIDAFNISTFAPRGRLVISKR